MPYAPRTYPLTPMPQPQDPLSSLSNLMAVGSQLENWQENRRQQQQQKLVVTALNEAQGDYGKAAESLGRQGMWELAKPLEEKAAELRRGLVDQVSTRLNQNKTIFGQSAQFLKEIEAKPELYPDLRPKLVELATALDPRLAQEIPEAYEPERVRGMLQFVEGGASVIDSRARAAAAAKAALDEREARVKDLGSARKVVSDWFSVSDNQDDWDQSFNAMRGLVPDEVLQQIGPTWSKEAQERARQMGLTPEQKGTEARAKIDDDRADKSAKATADYRAAMLGISRQRESRLSREERDGATPTGRATAERWKSSQLEALETEFTGGQTNMTEADLRRRQLQIENSYRAQIGLKPLAALPKEWFGGAASPAPAPPAPAAPAAPKAGDFKMTVQTGGRVTVTAPDGSTATFESQDEANRVIEEFLRQSR